MQKKLLAEFLGTFWLVLGGCGSAVMSLAFPEFGIGILGVATAFGLALATGIYAFGGISGGHFNPAVSVGLAAAGRFPRKDVLGYVGAQVIGAIAACTVIYWIASGRPGFSVGMGFAENGYGMYSPGGYSLGAALVSEIVMTAVFVMVILAVTRKDANPLMAPLAIGLTLWLIHLISIPVTNTAVNPARATGPALFVGGAALGQLWAFWVAPLIGGVLGATIYQFLTTGKVKLAEQEDEEIEPMQGRAHPRNQTTTSKRDTPAA